MRGPGTEVLVTPLPQGKPDLHMLRPFRAPIFILVLLAPFLGSCASYSHIRFAPNPLDVALESEEQDSLGRALISVRGISTSGPEESLEIGLRMRLDNDGESALRLLPEECELVDAALRAFVAPRIGRVEPRAGDAMTIGGGEGAVFDFYFPLAADTKPEDYDLRGLNLRWGLETIDGRVLHWSSSFERARREYPDFDGRYYYPWVGFRHPAYYGAGFRWP